MVDLVAQDHERRLAQFLHAEQRIQLCLAFLESFMIFRIYEEYDARYFREVVPPESSGLRVTAKVESGEFDVAYCEFL